MSALVLGLVDSLAISEPPEQLWIQRLALVLDNSSQRSDTQTFFRPDGAGAELALNPSLRRDRGHRRHSDVFLRSLSCCGELNSAVRRPEQWPRGPRVAFRFDLICAWTHTLVSGSRPCENRLSRLTGVRFHIPVLPPTPSPSRTWSAVCPVWSDLDLNAYDFSA